MRNRLRKPIAKTLAFALAPTLQWFRGMTTTQTTVRECRCSAYNRPVCEKRAARGLLCLAVMPMPAHLSPEAAAERCREGWRRDHGMLGGRRRAVTP